MKRYRLILFMIICSLLTACGQTTSVSEAIVSSTSETVISESVTEAEPEPVEEILEDVSEGDVYEEVLQKPEMKENYSDWQEAYTDFIEFQAWQDAEETSEFWGKSFDKEDIDWTKDHNSYYLIYVDNDDIPELFISTNSTAGGCIVVTFYDGKCTWDYIADETSRYIPYGGYLYVDDGKGFIYIKKLVKGQFDTVFFGEYHRFSPDGNDEHEECEYWLLSAETEEITEENSVTEKEFKAAIKQHLNIEKAVWPERDYKYAEISSVLAKGEGQMLIDEWRKAYVDYIGEHYSFHESYSDTFFYDTLSYSLIYLDDDDIPEIFIDTGVEAGGEYVLAYHDGKVTELCLPRIGSQYIEKSGLIYTDTGHMGEYPVTITKLDKGTFTEIGSGVYRENIFAIGDDEYKVEYEYEWEGKSVSEKAFKTNISKLYNLKKSKCPEGYNDYIEFDSILKTGHHRSAGHRYEFRVGDVTWEQAFQEAKDAGGYLAILTAHEEYEKVADLIKQEGLTSYLFHVSHTTGRRDSSYGWVYPDGSVLQEPFQHICYGDPDYTFEWSNWKYEDAIYGLLKYSPTDSNVYLYWAPVNIFGYINDDGSYVTERFKGQIGYIIEYDN